MSSSDSVLNRLRHAMRQLLRSALLLRHRIFGWYLRAAIRPDTGQAPLLAPHEVASILIIRADEIGDFALTTPFLCAIRAHYKAAKITLLIKGEIGALARACPYIDEVLELPGWRKIPPPFDQVAAYIRAKRFAGAHLVERKFQYVMNPRVDVDIVGALAMAYHARIPYRIGYGEDAVPLRAIKDAGYNVFLTHRVLPAGHVHDVISALRVAQFCGAHIKDTRLQLWPDAASRTLVDGLLAGFRQPGRRLIAMAPGASLGRRRWPIAAFASLAAQLTTQLSAQIVVVGGGEDVSLGDFLLDVGSSQGRHVLNLAGRLRLQETAALLGDCALFIGNDSGPMHMAAAMGVACVEISCHPVGADPTGANSPLRFAPWGVPHRILQPLYAIRPCDDGCTKAYAHCIKSVTTEQVFGAVQELLPADAVPGVERLHEQRSV